MSEGLVIGATDRFVMWCLGAAVERARRDADRGGLRHVGLVVGSPRADQWPAVREMERVVTVLGAEPRHASYAPLAAERADVLCLPEPADLGAVVGTDRPCVVTGLPGPPAGAVPPQDEGLRAGRISEALLESEDPPDPTTVAIVEGRGSAILARAAAAWRESMPVVAITDGPAPEGLRFGGTLVAERTLLAYEATDALARGAPLRRSVARRAEKALHAMPSTPEVAARLLEAMILASASPDRTAFVSA